MKNIYFIFLALVFASCNHTIIFESSNVLKGSGKIITKTIDINALTEVEQSSSIDVIINNNDTEKVTIETDDNIMQYVEYKIKNNKITFDFKNERSYNEINPTKCRIYVYLKQLSKVENNGSGDIDINNFNNNFINVYNSGSGNINLYNITLTNLTIKNDGSGDIKGINSILNKVTINNEGSGDILMQGKANISDITNGGSGNINTLNLFANTTSVSNSGSGNIEVFVEKEISIINNGYGDVKYKGNPSVKSINNNGSGDIISACQ